MQKPDRDYFGLKVVLGVFFGTLLALTVITTLVIWVASRFTW